MHPKDSANTHKAKEQLALALINQGKLKEAEDIYTNLVNSGISNDIVYGNLGALLQQKGDLVSATLLLKRSLWLNPNNPNVYNNLGIALEDQGDLTSAIASFKRAIELKPNFSEFYYNLGNAFKKKGDLDSAIFSYRDAIHFKQNYPEAHYNLGNALKDKGDLTAAITAYNTALQFKQNYPEAHYNLGNALKDKGDLTAAITAYNTALQLNPNQPDVYNNLGNALKDQGNFDAAIISYNKSLELRPNNPDAHLSYALTMLLMGDYKNGWEKYSWRTKISSNPSIPSALPMCKLWNGEPLAHETKLLLVTEQGLGDILQFMRYALALRCQKLSISICAQPRLHPLIQSSGIDSSPLTPEQANQVTEGQWIPLLSVPRQLKVSPSNPIINKPYIKSSTELNKKWKAILSTETKPTVGINWRGNRNDTSRLNRNIPTHMFREMNEAFTGHLLCLQRHSHPSEIDEITFNRKMMPYQLDVLRIADSNMPEDFLEYAAIIANCDLVITTGSTVAHLAAGIGIPTWVLLPKLPDWRWGLEGETSFWYPSIRLFRQRDRGNWDEVMERVADALQEHFRDSPTPSQPA
jgi:tetratricopeptide (TPR) repeat protein